MKISAFENQISTRQTQDSSTDLPVECDNYNYAETCFKLLVEFSSFRAFLVLTHGPTDWVFNVGVRLGFTNLTSAPTSQYKHKHSTWTAKITGIPGQIENRVISAYPFTKINHFSESKVVVHSNRYGVTVACLCRGGLFQKMARIKNV